MYISQLKLRNWKNFKQTEGSFQHRVFLIGPNASGKSNLLDALRFLRDLTINGLSKAVAERGGVSLLRCLAATRYSSIDLDVTLADDSGDTHWGYRLVFSQDKQGRPVVKEETVIRNGEKVLKRPDPDDNQDLERLTYTAIEQVVANRDFRDVAEFFRTISYQHLLPQVVRDPRGFSPTIVHNDPFGRDFLLRLWKTTKATRDSRLAKIKDVLKVAVPQLQDLHAEMDSQGTPHLVGVYEHWRPNAGRQFENQFSDGTLRLVGLLWSMFEGHGPLLMEEPELSLHADVVRYLPQMFERIQKFRKVRRQIFISTHSEDILSDTGIDPDEVLRLEPSTQGTLLKGPDAEDKDKMKAGLTAADVLLPKSAPKNSDQLAFAFNS
ncbi:MAG: AAA family ATPase [Nitrospiraceae bacterium]|nr:AAA family ATPase [Nitrospiraceae bacterium]